MTCLADSISSGETNVYNFWINLWDWKSRLSLKQEEGGNTDQVLCMVSSWRFGKLAIGVWKRSQFKLSPRKKSESTRSLSATLVCSQMTFKVRGRQIAMIEGIKRTTVAQFSGQAVWKIAKLK